MERAPSFPGLTWESVRDNQEGVGPTWTATFEDPDVMPGPMVILVSANLDLNEVLWEVSGRSHWGHEIVREGSVRYNYDGCIDDAKAAARTAAAVAFTQWVGDVDWNANPPRPGLPVFEWVI